MQNMEKSGGILCCNNINIIIYDAFVKSSNKGNRLFLHDVSFRKFIIEYFKNLGLNLLVAVKYYFMHLKVYERWIRND